MQHSYKCKQQSLRGRNSFLSIDSQHEVSLVQRLKGRWHDAVGAGRQLVSTAHFAHVDERRRLAHRCIVLEVAHIQRSAARVFQLRKIIVLISYKLQKCLFLLILIKLN